MPRHSSWYGGRRGGRWGGGGFFQDYGPHMYGGAYGMHPAIPLALLIAILFVAARR